MVASSGKNLLDLPTELLLMIVDATEKSSLANLHLTCREIRDLTNDAFGSAFFINRHIVFSIFSVDRLLDITEHPVFGRYVKEIAFASDFFQRPFGDNSERVFYHHIITQAIFSTISEVFQNVQNNHGSVDLVFYDHQNRLTYTPIRQHLAEVFYDVTRMVEQSGSA